MNNLDMYSREKTNQLRLDELHGQARSRRMRREADRQKGSKTILTRQIGGITVSLAILNLAITLCICNQPGG